MRTKIALLVIFALLIAGFFIWHTEHGRTKQSQVLSASGPNFDINQMLTLTNKDRVASGVAPLKLDARLNESAQAKCSDMAKNDYFSHTNSDGSNGWDYIKNYTSGYSYGGENLLTYVLPVADPDLENAWMASQGHRANILKPQFTDAGFAYCHEDAQGNELVSHHYYVEHFAY